MIGLLFEIAVSVLICWAGAYFFFLSNPAEERGVGEENAPHELGAGMRTHRGSGECRSSGAHNRRSTTSIERSRKCEPAMWCNVVGRLISLLVLGGGSVDGDVWVDRIAYLVDKAVKNAESAFNKRCNERAVRRTVRALRAKTDVVKLLRMELSGGGALGASGNIHQQQSHSASAQVGGMFQARTNSEHARVISVFAEVPEGSTSAGVGPAVAAPPAVGVVLPRVGPAGITSVEVPLNAATQELGLDDCGSYMALCGGHGMLRCFAVPISYEDHRFLLSFLCNLPLFFALPPSLSIPPDVLTLRCGLTVRRVIFHGTLCAAFCGNRVELSFSSEPQFTALYDVTPPQRRHRQQNQRHHEHQAHTQPNLCGEGGSGSAAAACVGGVPLPPLAQSVHGGRSSFNHYSASMSMGTVNGAQRTKEKLQEIVDIAVRRAVQSITYPCVLRGCIDISRKPKCPNGMGHCTQLSESCDGGFITWTLEKVSLPLCC
uniref:Uncharacterized protein TCIL3000_11_12920 n=1 Tax=Trypanosoma congolense (strain IL3000) TaxID=1068625 RepID=G0V2C2_TRYCI|nr:unnamed protein product [Trypanosoma congolense IL3000]